MKIKEVITATGLSDRAIRLYIEEGLLSPDIKQNYSGRRNIDFSVADVEKLKNISVLRRAGFSIPQIKALDEGGESAEAAFRNFVKEKETQHKFDETVLAALGGFSSEEATPTISSVAGLLNDEILKDIKNKDIKPTFSEVISKIVTIIYATVSGTVLGLASLKIIDYYNDSFRFPVFNGNVISLIITLFLFINTCFAPVIIVLNLKPAYTEDRVKRRKKLTERLARFIALQLVFIYPTMLFSNWIPFIDSKTSDVADYLVLDEYINYRCSEEIYRIFPAYLPKSVVTNTESNRENPPKYYYCFSNEVDSVADIYAEWTLPEDEYNGEKIRLLAAFPEAEKELKGNYTVLTFKFSMAKGYFAYNDETLTLRYGYAYRLSWAADPITYFDELEWENQ